MAKQNFPVVLKAAIAYYPGSFPSYVVVELGTLPHDMASPSYSFLADGGVKG